MRITTGYVRGPDYHKKEGKKSFGTLGAPLIYSVTPVIYSVTPAQAGVHLNQTFLDEKRMNSTGSHVGYSECH